MRMLVSALALGVGVQLASPLHAGFSRQQLIDYVKAGWKLTDITDELISETLDTSYSGIPFKDYVSYFAAAPGILNPLANGDYLTAGRKAAELGFERTVSFGLRRAGLAGVAAPAQLAAWPIEHGLNAFYQAVAAGSFKKQMALYFEAREFNSYAAIVSLEPADLLDGVDISKTDQGWLFKHLSYLYGSVPGYTPAQFFEYAELVWQADQAIARYLADQSVVRDAFRAAAAPQRPVIIAHPINAVIAPGETVTLSVMATGDAPLAYRWWHNGELVPGAVDSTLVVGSAGDYFVEVSNAAGTTPSRTAVVTISANVEVAVTHPSDGDQVSGPVTVRVLADAATKVEFFLDDVRHYTDSAAPYAWAWNTLTSANGPHTLAAKAYNADGTTTSTPVQVLVDNAPPATCDDPHEPNDSSLSATPLELGTPAAGYICTGADVDWFRVEVTTPGVLTFELTVPAANDYDLELFGPDTTYLTGSYGATGLAEHLTHNATVAGAYYVRVYGYPVGSGSHNAAETYSLTAETVSGPITILTHPQDRAVPAGASASFSVTASGAPPLTYQWLRDDVEIPGATGPTYAISSLTLADSGGQFRARVANPFGSVLSEPATLTIFAANTITWTGAAGGTDWFNPSNWNPNVVPGSHDVVTVNVANLALPATAEFAVMNLLGGNLTGTFTNRGTINWLGGGVSGVLRIAPEGVVNLLGDGPKECRGGTVINEGLLNWEGAGNWRTHSRWPVYRSVITNLVGGVVRVTGSGGFNQATTDSGWTVVNEGLWRFEGEGKTNVIERWSAFTNAGRLEVSGATLEVGGQLGGSGEFEARDGGRLVWLYGSGCEWGEEAEVVAGQGSEFEYRGSDLKVAPGATFAGPGLYRISGRVSGQGTLSFPGLELAAGTDLAGTFTNRGTINWLSGGVSGVLRIAPEGVVNLMGDGPKECRGGTVINEGLLNWEGAGNWRTHSRWPVYRSAITNLVGGVVRVTGSGGLNRATTDGGWTVVNEGLWRFEGEGKTNVIERWSAFTNAGRLEVSGATLEVGGQLANVGQLDLQGGIIAMENGYVQTAGETRLAGGSISGTTLSFNGGILSGTGNINASVVNGAVVRPGSSPGVLTINGNYTQLPTGVLQMEMGGIIPGTGFDQLVVTGQAKLAGTLDVTLIDGFIPALDNAFSVLTCASRSGSFITVNLPAIADFLTLALDDLPDGVTLRVTQSSEQQPNTLALVSSEAGTLALRFVGEPDQTYHLQGSTNLVDWQEVATQNSATGVIEFADPDGQNQPHRFYRVVGEQPESTRGTAISGF